MPILEKLAAALSATPDPTLVVDSTGTVLLANDEVERSYGHAPQALIGKAIETLIPSLPLNRGEVDGLAEHDGSWRGATRYCRDLYANHADHRHIPVALALREVRTEKGLVQIVSIRPRMSHDYVSLLVSHAALAIAVFDVDMRYIQVSERWLRDYGVQASDIIGRNHYDLFPHTPPHWREAHRRALSGYTVPSTEGTFTHTDGRKTRIRGEIMPWRTAEGRVGGIVIFTEPVNADGLDRRSADFGLLLKETNHRVFNSLQLLGSMVLLEASSAQSEETRAHLADLQARLAALSNVHGQLYRSQSHRSIDVRGYLQSLCQNLREAVVDGRPIELKVVTGKGELDADTAANVGLITMELVMNALKHAFPDGQAGKVVVSYASASNGWCLAVSDNGVGSSSGKPKMDGTGLGTRILALLSEQLGGTITTSPRSVGTRVALTVPTRSNRKARKEEGAG